MSRIMITIILVSVDVDEYASMYCVYAMYESIGFVLMSLWTRKQDELNRPKSWYDDSSFNDDDSKWF